MAAEVIFEIKPDGSGDYTTARAALLAEVAVDWVANDEFGVFEISGDWSGSPELGNWPISGGTMSALGGEHGIEVRTDAANRPTGTALDASRYQLQLNALPGISVGSTNVKFSGVQVNGRRGSYNTVGVEVVAANGLHLDRCLLTAISYEGIQCYGSLWMSSSVLHNCGNRGIRGRSGCSVIANACTITDLSRDGFNIESGTASVECNNCLVSDSGWEDFGVSGGTFSGDYNAGQDASVPGGNSISSSIFTFVDAAGDDFQLDPLDSSGAIGGGADLSAHATLPVTHDFLGNPFAPAPTIGAIENNPPASGGTLSSSQALESIVGTASADVLITADSPQTIGDIAGSAAAQVALSLSSVADLGDMIGDSSVEAVVSLSSLQSLESIAGFAGIGAPVVLGSIQGLQDIIGVIDASALVSAASSQVLGDVFVSQAPSAELPNVAFALAREGVVNFSREAAQIVSWRKN